MTDDWQVVEEALNTRPVFNTQSHLESLAALARLREREAQLEQERDARWDDGGRAYRKALFDEVLELRTRAEAAEACVAPLENGCEQALLLLERERFADDPEAKVVRAVLRSALAHEEEK